MLSDKVNCWILGDSGFAREVQEWAEDAGYAVSGLVGKDGERAFIGFCEAAYKLDNSYRAKIFLGVGSPQLKYKMVDRFFGRDWAEFPALIHPSVIKGDDVVIGDGCIICPNTIITCGVKICDFVTVNLACTIGHDSYVGPYSSLMPQVAISGGVTLYCYTYCGVGAAILENICVGESAIIGAGAVVTKHVPSHETWVGVPAKCVGGVSP